MGAVSLLIYTLIHLEFTFSPEYCFNVNAIIYIVSWK